jgi:tight adherence protein C
MLLNNRWLIQLLVFLAVTIIVALIAQYFSSHQTTLDSRLRKSLDDPSKNKFQSRLTRLVAGRTGAMLLAGPLRNWSERILCDDMTTRTQLQDRLIKAGIYRRDAVSIYCFCVLVLVALPAIVSFGALWNGSVNWKQATLYAAVGSCVGAYLPRLVLSFKTSSRQTTLRKALPDYLDLLVACLDGGNGLSSAMIRVTDELHSAHPSLCTEMLLVQREVYLGHTTPKALMNLHGRSDLEEFRSLATYVQHAERFGTTMADAMRELSNALRTQRENRAEEAAHKASVKILIPTMLFIFPAIFIVLVGPAAIKLHAAFGR